MEFSEKHVWRQLMKYWFIEILIQWSNILLFFICQAFEILCMFYTISTSQFKLVTFRVFSGHRWLVASKLYSAALERLSLLCHISVEDSSAIRELKSCHLSWCMLFYNWVENEKLHREKTILNHICFNHFSPLQCDNQKLVLLKKYQCYWMRALEGKFSWLSVKWRQRELE